MSGEYGSVSRKMIDAIESDELPAARGYLVGLDRPALLSPDPAAILAAERESDILASGYRWRVVTEGLWQDLLALGRERPVQQVYVVSIADIETWLEDNPEDLAELDPDGWRGNQGTMFVLPIL